MGQRGATSRRSCHVFAEAYPHSWRCGIATLLLALFSTAAAVWVFLDARAHWRPEVAVACALGTLLAVGLALPAYLLVRPSRGPAWGTGEILGLTILFMMAIPLVGDAVFHVPAGVVPPLPVIATLAVLQNAAFVAAGLYLVRVKYHLPLGSLGFPRGVWTRWVRQGAIAGIVALVANSIGQHATAFALTLVMGERAAGEFIAREAVRTPIYRLVPLLHQRLEVIALAVLVGIVVPVGEEVFFRGLAFGALRRSLGRHLAVALSALFFAAAHVHAIELLPIALLGAILAYTYEFTGSLVPGMIAHGINNVAALLFFVQSPPP